MMARVSRAKEMIWGVRRGWWDLPEPAVCEELSRFRFDSNAEATFCLVRIFYLLHAIRKTKTW
jgi:hypothetical protein